MSQAMRFNVAALIGLVLFFAGASKVFGLWPALMVLGWLVWFTALYCAHVFIAARGRPG